MHAIGKSICYPYVNIKNLLLCSNLLLMSRGPDRNDQKAGYGAWVVQCPGLPYWVVIAPLSVSHTFCSVIQNSVVVIVVVVAAAAESFHSWGSHMLFVCVFWWTGMALDPQKKERLSTLWCTALATSKPGPLQVNKQTQNALVSIST